MELFSSKYISITILVINLLVYYLILFYFFYIFFSSIYNKNYSYNNSVKQIITRRFFQGTPNIKCTEFENGIFPQEIVDLFDSYSSLLHPRMYFIYFLSFLFFTFKHHINFQQIIANEKEIRKTEHQLRILQLEEFELKKEIEEDTKELSTGQSICTLIPVGMNKEKKRKIADIRDLKEILTENLNKRIAKSSAKKILYFLQFFLANFIMFVFDLVNYSQFCIQISFTSKHFLSDYKGWYQCFLYLNMAFTVLFCILLIFYFIWVILYLFFRMTAYQTDVYLKKYIFFCYLFYFLIHIFTFPRSAYDFNLKCFNYFVNTSKYDYGKLTYLILLVVFEVVVVEELFRNFYKMLKSCFFVLSNQYSRRNKIFNQQSFNL